MKESGVTTATRVLGGEYAKTEASQVELKRVVLLQNSSNGRLRRQHIVHMFGDHCDRPHYGKTTRCISHCYSYNTVGICWC